MDIDSLSLLIYLYGQLGIPAYRTVVLLLLYYYCISYYT